MKSRAKELSEIRKETNMGLHAGDIVKFHTPTTDDEITARMMVIWNEGSRMIVSDIRFMNNPRYPIAPTMSILTADVIKA